MCVCIYIPSIGTSNDDNKNKENKDLNEDFSLKLEDRERKLQEELEQIQKKRKAKDQRTKSIN